MRLKDIDLDRIIPQFMEDDASVKAMNAVLEPVIKKLASELDRLPMWNNLSSLTDEELDNIAYEFDIPWYNNMYAREKKINIIKNGVELTNRLGTPYTFVQVLQDIFGGCELQEAGIHYDGLPHHFQIQVSNGENLDEVSYGRLQYLIDKIKRKSSWLDKVLSIYNSDMIEQHAMRIQDIAIDSISFDTNGLVAF